MSQLYDILNAINHTKEPIIDQGEVSEKDYPSFVVNRCLSYFMDTVLHANEMNRYPLLPNAMQFDYLQGAIRKRKRFAKWSKPKQDEAAEALKILYGYGTETAMEAAGILTEEQREQVIALVQHGGKE